MDRAYRRVTFPSGEETLTGALFAAVVDHLDAALGRTDATAAAEPERPGT